MTGADALTGLISLVGAGGITSVVIAFLAYKTEAAKGRRAPMEADSLVSANGTYPGSHDIELLANAIALNAAALGRANLLAEFRMGTTEFRMGTTRSAKFRTWLEDREMRDLYEQMKRGQGAGHMERPG